LSVSDSSDVSRKDEIRALFIFGLLAVFASIRVLNSELNIKLTYGTINFAPILDDLIILWSFYAFFMVIGLSSDILGKTTATIFRDLSKFFLQYSYIILGVLLFPFGIVAYGSRVILIGFLILLIVIIVFISHLNRQRVSHSKLILKDYFKPETRKKTFRSISSFALILSIVGIIQYPETWFAALDVILLSYSVAAVAIALILVLNEPKADPPESIEADGSY
jgi:hypothetical protein